ncbi:ArnT family glycosyltransferase [Aestuariibius sp. 2305UL40-4]|uniref:ArnT family glycosyltransferase n=1 Tax=Aestuariibius violaceus TaxID=3234132 RepID=UPI00345ED2D1
MTSRAEGWLAPALTLVIVLVGLRIVALWFAKADLFVDEAQYWFWGQSLDFGYYSKPPLIAWVIRGMTDLVGSDAPFWVRLPAPILHGVTALLLGALAARIAGRTVAVWTVATYLTLPIVAVGSFLISTDTVMAPFLVGALLAYLRVLRGGGAGWAVLSGALFGLAMMGKYAGVYGLLGVALAAVFLKAARPGWVNGALVLLFALVFLGPNIWWNFANDLTTVEHTLDNVSWVREADPVSWNVLGLLGFLAGQLLVFGPILLPAFIWACIRQGGWEGRWLAFLSLPVLLVVSGQALLAEAYGNWAFVAYLGGTILAVWFLLDRGAVLLGLSVAFNALVSTFIAIAPIVPDSLRWGDGDSLMARYMGRDEVSLAILDLAEQEGLDVIVASNRDILADLFYTARDSEVTIYAESDGGRPDHFYEQTRAEPDDLGRHIRIVSRDPNCGVQIADLSPDEGAYAGDSILAYWVEGPCLP